jgi:voltage-gated potassium channel
VHYAQMRPRSLRSSVKTTLLGFIVVVLGCAATFYLFVVPMLVANQPEPGLGGYVAAAFGAFMLFQVWLLVATWAGEALAILYGRRPPVLTRMFKRIAISRRGARAGDAATTAPLYAAFTGLASFFLTTYAFAVSYLFVSRRDAEAFGVGTLGPLKAIYFGFATAVTYGDLDPLSTSARLLVLAQLVVSLAYALFLFSVLAGVLQDRRRDR